MESGTRGARSPSDGPSTPTTSSGTSHMDDTKSDKPFRHPTPVTKMLRKWFMSNRTVSSALSGRSCGC